MQTKTLIYHQSRISYKIYGSGKPMLLLHGFGEDGSIWYEQVRFLKDQYMLIVPDLPGSGASEILQKEKVQICDYAELIKAILSGENIAAVTFIGHSMGGYIALAFAKKYPESISALGLFHSGAFADAEDKIAIRKKGIQFIEANGSKAFLKTSITGLFYDAEKSKDHIETLIEKAGRFLPAALIQYYRAMIDRPDATAVLKTIQKPVLFMIGEHDKAIPFPHSLKQVHLPDHAHIAILRNSAHMGLLEETAESNEILAQFLHSI